MSDEDVRQSFQLGDEVRIATDDGAYFRFTVTEVTPEAISGDDIRVPVSEIKWLESNQSVVARDTATIVGGSFMFVIINAVGVVLLVGQ